MSAGLAVECGFERQIGAQRSVRGSAVELDLEALFTRPRSVRGPAWLSRHLDVSLLRGVSPVRRPLAWSDGAASVVSPRVVSG
jgi:hypothetical protein